MTKPIHPRHYRSKLAKLQQIVMREMMDGCCDCREQNGLCRKHWIEAAEMFLKPRKNTEKIFGPPGGASR